MRAEQMALQQAALPAKQDKIAHLQKFINRFKAKASKAKQAQSRVKALERMEKPGAGAGDADFTFEFKEPLNLPNPMLSMLDASFGYPPPEDAPPARRRPPSCSTSTARCFAGQRIGILGANGQGKSTLVKTIARTLPWSRQGDRGQGPQHRLLRPAGTRRAAPPGHPLEHMIRLARDTIAAGRRPVQQPRAGPAQLPRHLQLQRRHGQAGGGHHERRRESAAGAVHDRLAAPQPAAARRADQPPGPRHPRGAGDGAQRVRRHGDAGQPRPGAAALRVRRVLAGEQGRGRAVRRRPRRLPALSAGREQAPARKPEGDRPDGGVRQDCATTRGGEAHVAPSGKLKSLKQSLEKLDKSMAALQLERSELEARLAGNLSVEDIAAAGKQLQHVNEELVREEEKWLELSGEIEELEGASA
jgi:ATP-binding cassette, subfamily F, member 3